jgi:predicted GNAT family N-acyltransferase
MMPVPHEIIIKRPGEFSKSEKTAFVRFVANAGEVAAGLPELVEKAQVLVMLCNEGELIGTAAIKRPRSHYHEGVFKKAASPAAFIDYPFEIGWIVVDQRYQGQQLSGQLIDAALGAVSGARIYATTRANNTRIHRVLKTRGFVRNGKPYASGQHEGEDIVLYLK